MAAKWYGDPVLMGHLEQAYALPGYEEAVLLTSGCFLSSASSLLLRRDAFEAAGSFDARLWLAADWDLYLSILRHHDIVYTPEPLSCYRSHKVTVTSSTKSALRGVEDAYCLARAYLWMREDERCTEEMRATVLRRVKAQLFDLAANPDLTIPDHLRYAAEIILQAAPDRRLTQAVVRQTDEKVPARK